MKRFSLRFLPRLSMLASCRTRELATLAIALLLSAMSTLATQADEGEDFFESRIRPVLIERCYECHNTAETAEADLALDWRDGIRAKTEHGVVVAPGKPAESLLLQVIRHELPDLEMPESGPKLAASVVADFEKWIEMGAPDPRDAPPTADELSEATSWEKTLEKRKEWWSFQPIKETPPPTATQERHPVDRFIQAKLSEQGLAPAGIADRRTLIRRLSFALTGLPPTPADINAFVDDKADDAFERLVDKYLDSPHFGERWARHWMDLVRYADSHGSEGDPQIPHSYQYRDYLIRAFNEDVPYDQLVREHLAGDLLEQPRTNKELGINESAIGPAHFRFVFHGFAPTDALDEKVRFTDDQINVVSKAFLGLTVSCARCHDHKFDAISQADYYAMFGIFASCRPALRDVNLPDRKTVGIEEIDQLKTKLRSELATDWLQSVEDLAERLLDPNEELASQFKESKQKEQLLTVWKQLSGAGEKETENENEETQDGEKDVSLADQWKTLYDQWKKQRDFSEQPTNARRWNLSSDADYQAWFRFGNGLPSQPTAPGEFALNSDGTVVSGIFPAGVISHRVSQSHRGFLASPRFKLDEEWDAWLLVAGDGQPSLRYVVENYPRNGTVYPIKTINSSQFRWEKLNLKYWTGDNIHFELATSKDAPLQNRNRDESWFAIRDVVLRKSGEEGPPAVSLEYLSPVFEISKESPKSKAELAGRIQDALTSAIRAWRDGSASDQQALLLNACLPLLPNETESLPTASETIAAIRKHQSEIPQPTRVPGVVEADAFDQPLFVRGDHRKPADVVKRRFLEAIDSTPYVTEQSGRLNLADSILHADNPLTARVMANRIWHYVFGRGIVTTPDNFGQLGSRPSHPALLDYLASRMRKNGWSIKDSVRFLVTSDTWKTVATPSKSATEKDPENRLLSHANVQRLDAESIRDSLLAVSGELDNAMYGQGFGANSDATRRSVYITSRRNSLDDFLKTFDSPTPFATTGRRDQTNVPSQSLTMLNDPMVWRLSKAWTKTVNGLSPQERVASMIQKAFGREVDAIERETLLKYVAAMETEFAADEMQRAKAVRLVDETRQAISSIVAPARESILKARNSPGDSDEDSDATATVASGLAPIAAWDFEGNLDDSVGNLKARLQAGAKIENGALVLDGDGYASTGKLPKDLKAKTLEAWVQLATLEQGGGGVITVQTRNAVIFDSIVYAERQPNQWMAGSNGFVRTEDFGGEAEMEAAKKVVHVAITYDDEGKIRFYRNGKRSGKSTGKGGLQSFVGRDSQILFGMRHGEVEKNDEGRKLRGQIFAARLYDRALSDEEVLASASGGNYVSEQMLAESLSSEQNKQLATLRSQLANAEEEISKLPKAHEPNEAWTRLAHAIFNLKEFIYIK